MLDADWVCLVAVAQTKVRSENSNEHIRWIRVFVRKSKQSGNLRELLWL